MRKSKRILFICLLIISICILSACKSGKIPELEKVVNYSRDELQDLAKIVDEKSLIKKWGEPQRLNNRRIWSVPLTGETKFVSAWTDNGKVISINVSQILYVTVVSVENNVAYCTLGWDDFSTDMNNLTFMPEKDIFGNDIICKVGDEFIFQFDGMMMETYPLQLNPPYSATLAGQ